jgi:hypothetical protein
MQILKGAVEFSKALGDQPTNLMKFRRNAAFT